MYGPLKSCISLVVTPAAGQAKFLFQCRFTLAGYQSMADRIKPWNDVWMASTNPISCMLSFAHRLPLRQTELEADGVSWEYPANKVVV